MGTITVQGLKILQSRNANYKNNGKHKTVVSVALANINDNTQTAWW